MFSRNGTNRSTGISSEKIDIIREKINAAEAVLIGAGAGLSAAAERYEAFIRGYKDKRIVFLELGVGFNTPAIIKYPFWKMTAQNEKAFYICLNKGEAFCPDELGGRAVCIDGDTDSVISAI